MRHLDISVFSQCLNQAFQVDIGSCEVNMTLVDIKKHKVMQFPGISRDPFSLIFRSENQVILPQKIYEMSNDVVGKVGIFIVPVGRDVSGVIYEALFN